MKRHAGADPRLLAFLDVLRERRLDTIVVVGGAVRDLLLRRRCRDIDVAVRLDVAAPDEVQEHGDPAPPLRLLPVLEQALRPLAHAMGCDVSAAIDPMPFRDLSVDVLGLFPIRDRTGVEFPDIFVDTADRVFGARPDLTVNRLAMDPAGRIWPDAAVRDLYLRQARLTAAPLGVQLRQVLRVLNTCADVGLKLVPAAAAVLQEHVDRLIDVKQFRQEARDRFVESQFRRMAKNAPAVAVDGRPNAAGRLWRNVLGLMRQHCADDDRSGLAW